MRSESGPGKEPGEPCLVCQPGGISAQSNHMLFTHINSVNTQEGVKAGVLEEGSRSLVWRRVDCTRKMGGEGKGD